MNTLSVLLGLVVMVAVVSGLGYNTYNTYPSVDLWSSRRGNFLNGGLNLGGRRSLRYKRAAVGYGLHRGGVLGHLGGNFGGRLGGRLSGWRNSGWNSFNGY